MSQLPGYWCPTVIHGRWTEWVQEVWWWKSAIQSVSCGWSNNPASLLHSIAWLLRGSCQKSWQTNSPSFNCKTSINVSELKEKLKPDDALLILHFAENYSFVVQVAAQGFRRDNSQATLHSFIACFKQDGQTQHVCMCVISDCLQHDTITVHWFQQPVLSHMEILCPNRRKVSYFPDGAASQYKNVKNLCNLVFHEADFGLQAEWHFSVTSHGKNACGVSGNVKTEAAKTSL